MLERSEERPLDSRQRPRRRAPAFAGAVPILLLQDIRRALVAGEQIRRLLGLDERLQRADAGEQTDEIVLSAEREHRVDQVVANAGFALLDLEAVGEEVEQNSLSG